MNNQNFNSNKYPNQYLSKPNTINNNNMPTNGAQPNMFYNNNSNNAKFVYPMQSYMNMPPAPPMNQYQIQQMSEQQARMGCPFGYNQLV